MAKTLYVIPSVPYLFSHIHLDLVFGAHEYKMSPWGKVLHLSLTFLPDSSEEL